MRIKTFEIFINESLKKARKSTFITENNVVYDGWTFDED